MVVSALGASLAAVVPLDPEPPVATDWLVEELSKAPYQAAQPTLIDIIAKAVSDWLGSLRVGAIEGPPALGFLVLGIVVAAAIVVAILVFGLPRLNRRSAVAGALFGDDDARSAARIRQDAQRAAADGDHSLAIAEMFRAIARGLAERSIVSTNPGTTARDFAVRAAVAFPSQREALTSASTAFDEVRYLGRDGTRERYAEVESLESELRAARPVLEDAPA